MLKYVTSCLRKAVYLLGIGLIAGCASDQEIYQPPAEAASITSFGTLPFLSRVALCPSMNVKNPPEKDAVGYVDFAPFIAVDETIVLATTPLEAGCLSSGYGLRSNRMHKGIDYHHSQPVEIYAAGRGRILETGVHRDFGNYVLIYHGQGIYTRYAHMESITPELAYGQEIDMGQTIGRMGRTGRRVTGRHLHYEVLKGNYNTPKKSFGLVAINIFELPQMWPQ